MNALTISLRTQLAEVRREIAMRQRVYPRWVASGKMSQTKADENIATMEAVRQTLAGLFEAERKAGELF